VSNLILVARLAGAFGVRGEVRLTTFTADPMAVMGYGVLRDKTGAPALTLSSGRPTKGGVIARAAEIATREAAEAVRGLELYIDRAVLPPPDEDEFYMADLVGLAVETPDGEPLGQVKAAHNFGAGDLLEIQLPDGDSWWLPFTQESVPEVRLGEGRIVAVRPEEIE
jgi:16S rRNA processing protein RimM